MSRKRSSEGSARDNKVETSGVLFELEDRPDKEKLSVRQRLKRLLAETEREKQDFDEITQRFSTGISTVKLAGMFIISSLIFHETIIIFREGRSL